MTEAAIIEACDNLTALIESGQIAPGDVLEQLAEFDIREDWVTIDGRKIDIGSGGAGVPMSKSELAKSAYNGGGTKHQQDLGEASEHELAKGLGVSKSEDNRPFDLFQGKIGIEVKTFVSNTNDKITMSKGAIERKVKAIREMKLTKTYTIVVDKRGELASSPKYYIRDGYGSFRLGSMQNMSMSEMKTYINKRGTGRFSL